MSESGKINPMVFAVVLNYNGWEDTIECINSLLNVNYSNLKIIIVDNNSNDGSVAEIISFLKSNKLGITSIDSIQAEKSKSDSGNITLISSKKNGGYGYGNNLGIKFAIANRADYILVLNNDTVVDSEFLQPLIDMCECDDKIGIASGKIYYYDKTDTIWSNGGHFHQCFGKVEQFNFNEKDIGQIVSKNITFLSGCMWMIPKHVFENVGLINEEFFMYFEDVEFSRRIINNGFYLKICNKSFIYHKVGKSTGGKFSKLSVYWRTRNMGIFLRRFNKNLFCSIISYVIFNIKMLFNLIRFGEISLIPVQISGIIDSLKRSN